MYLACSPGKYKSHLHVCVPGSGREPVLGEDAPGLRHSALSCAHPNRSAVAAGSLQFITCSQIAVVTVQVVEHCTWISMVGLGKHSAISFAGDVPGCQRHGAGQGGHGAAPAPSAQTLQYGTAMRAFPSHISLPLALMFSLTPVSRLGQIFHKYIFSPKSCFPGVGLMHNKLLQCLIYKAYEVPD